MGIEDTTPAHIQPSFFGKAFTLVGGFVAVGAVATMITLILVQGNEWYRHTYSIFGLSWGVCARLLAWSVRIGMKDTLASPYLSEEKRRILGEQLTMLQFTQWFIQFELVGSVLLLLVELLMPQFLFARY